MSSVSINDDLEYCISEGRVLAKPFGRERLGEREPPEVRDISVEVIVIQRIACSLAKQ